MVNNPLPRAGPLKKVGGIQLSEGWLLVWAAHRPAHEPHPGLSYALAPRRPAPLPQLTRAIPGSLPSALHGCDRALNPCSNAVCAILAQ